MASQLYLLLVNNIVVRDDDNKPIYEIQENGKKYYATTRNGEDKSERVQEVINAALTEDSKNEFYEALRVSEVITRHNHQFKLKMFITPLYDLLTQIASNQKATALPGSNLDVQDVWERQKYKFYVLEFTKYTQIMHYLEAAVRNSRPKRSPLTIKHEEHRVMSVVYIDVNGLFNPLDTIPFIRNTKLFETIYGDPEMTSFSLDAPAIFPCEIIRGTVKCYFATPSDVLKLCNVNYKDAVSSRDLYRLFAGIILKIMFPGSSRNGFFQAVLDLPVSKVLYRIADEETGATIRYFEDAFSAQNYASENGFLLDIIDTDARYIATAFPSFKGKRVTSEMDIIQEIRGAEFVS